MRKYIRQLLAITVVVSTGITAAVALRAQGNSRIQRGADVAPVPLNTRGLNPALVREGSYIVNAQGGCNDCHTVPSYADGGNPFLGEPELINAPCYLAGGLAFGPFTVSRNITPRQRPPGGSDARAVQADHARRHRLPESSGHHADPASDAVAGLRQDVGS